LLIDCADFQGKIKCIQNLKKYFTAYANRHTITVVKEPNKKVEKPQKRTTKLRSSWTGHSISFTARAAR